MTTLETFEQVMEWHKTLPPIVARQIKEKGIERMLQDWPEGEGFGSSDGWWALVSYVHDEGGTQAVQAAHQDLIDLETKLIGQGFDFEAGRRMFAPKEV